MNRVLLLALILVAAIACIGPAHAQITTKRDNFGTEFYVAFGPNEGYEDFNGATTSNAYDLYVTSRVVTRFTVEVPALNFYGVYTTTPGQIKTIHLPNGNNNSPTVELDRREDEQVIHGMAVHIVSDSDIAVFGMNHKKYSSDAFMALPNKVLGTEYRTINYLTSEPGQDETPGEFWLVAVEDSTNVTITPNDLTSEGTAKYSDINIRMDKGDVYLVQGSVDGPNDLTGSLIESDHAIAVFSGHRRTEMPEYAVNTDGNTSRDHLVEELPPVSAWGDSALVVPYASSRLPDLVRVVCAEGGTRIDTNGVNAGTFNAGEFLEIPELSGVMSIQASKPILVGQYMHTSYGSLHPSSPPPAYGDPALALVFPVEQFDTTYTVVSVVNPDAFSGNFVNIVVDNTGVPSMMMDGVPMNPKEFHPIPNTRYSYAQHQFDKQGTHNIWGKKPFGVTIYALGPVDSYSYTGGTLLKTITPLQTVSLVIDFGDRVLTPPLYPDTFDTTVYLENISDDVVNIYGFPRRIQDTGKFYVTKPVVSATAPFAMQPHTDRDSFTIEFKPGEVNRRMHTQVTAKTDHLRAYVVDVYGRGVIDAMGIFSDNRKIIQIDTLDFGFFDKRDGPADSAIYIGNNGTAPLEVQSLVISDDPTSPSGANAADFSESGTTPFTIQQAPSDAVRIPVRFTPQTTMPDGMRIARFTVQSKSSTHIIYLVAHMLTIGPAALDTLANGKPAPHDFGNLLVCSDAAFELPVTNPNSVPITITNAEIISTPNDPSSADNFTLTTRTPLIVPAKSTQHVEVHFSPNAKGSHAAKLVLTFNLPKDAVPDTVDISGSADKRMIEFAGATRVHSYASDDFLVPIYAKTDLTEYKADGWRMLVQYDSVNLKLIDVLSAGTLTPLGFAPVPFFSSPPGNDTVIFSQGTGEHKKGQPVIPIVPITGGGEGSQPFIYLKFRPVLHGADPQTFEKAFDIHYDVLLNNSIVPAECYDRVFDSGYVQIVSVCSNPYLEPQGDVPAMSMLEQPTPNPASAANSATAQYDVATEGHVTIQLADDAGNTVRTLVDEWKKPGYYTATIPAGALPSGIYFLAMHANNYSAVRRIVIAK